MSAPAGPGATFPTTEIDSKFGFYRVGGFPPALFFETGSECPAQGGEKNPGSAGYPEWIPAAITFHAKPGVLPEGVARFNNLVAVRGHDRFHDVVLDDRVQLP